MNFLIYDIALLVIFVMLVSIFLYRRRKNLKREGLLFLYKADWGIKFINKIGKKYQRTLKVLSYVSITLGYLLMAGMLYLFGRIVWIYIFQQDIVRAVKIPPIVPLIPYLPQIFKLDFLPPFYFIYWIVIIAIIAITHEVSHGIFAAYNKIKIKKTGFGFFPFFLPVFLAAFVELDEKQIAKKEIKKQMAVLSAGTFANVLTAILFFFALWGFFAASFAPAGVSFDTYSYSIVNVSKIISVNGIAIQSPSVQSILSSIDEGFNSIATKNRTYFITKEFLNKQKNIDGYILLYDNSPAIKANLTGAITAINGIKTDSKERLAQVLYSYKPGEEVTITTKTATETLNYDIVLTENPEEANIPYLGIAFSVPQQNGIMGVVYNLSHIIKKPNIYYEGKFGAATFIYDLFWWLVLMSISVALVNMLPVGIFDGGRFFFLTVLGITKSKRKAEIVFKFLTYLFLALVVVLMVFWAIGMFGK